MIHNYPFEHQWDILNDTKPPQEAAVKQMEQCGASLGRSEGKSGMIQSYNSETCRMKPSYPMSGSENLE